VYKAEVPYHGRADRQTIERRCREISAVLPCPWVVLSQGVDADDFPGAVEAACAGGASGFLAGRAVWADTIGTSDYRAAMETRSVARLETLGAIVDRAARPWWSAVETEEGGNA
jgi:sulfofructosephosphate aldolase